MDDYHVCGFKKVVILNRSSPQRDRNKYTGQHYAMPQTEYSQRGEVSLQICEQLLKTTSFLLVDTASVADIGITPIVRQFANMDRAVFYLLPYLNLQLWRDCWLQHPFFVQAMIKFQPWQEGEKVVFFPA